MGRLELPKSVICSMSLNCVVWSYDFFAASCLLLLLDSNMDISASNLRGFRSPCGVYLLLSAEAKMRLLVTNSVLTYGLHTLSHFLIASSASTVNSHNELSWLRSLQYGVCHIISLHHPVTVHAWSPTSSHYAFGISFPVAHFHYVGFPFT